MKEANIIEMPVRNSFTTKKQFTMGADPEIFVFEGLKLLPAYAFLPDKHSGSPIYWDGFQAEWRLDYENRHSQDAMIEHMRLSLQELLKKARERFPRARLSATNVVRIDDNLLETARDEHVALGCEPSYNAYKLKGLKVDNPRKLIWRVAGGHKHFGEWTTRPPYERIVKTLDKVLGVFSVGAARHVDNPIRRRYYGMPGEYRTPRYGDKYGVEYRVLSNFWTTSPLIQKMTWEVGVQTVKLATSPYSRLWATSEDEVRETILYYDIKQAERVIKRNKPMLTWMLKQTMREDAVQQAMNVFYGGIEEVVPDVNDFVKNWNLEV